VVERMTGEVQPSDVFKAAVDLIVAQNEEGGRWVGHFFTVQGLVAGGEAIALGLIQKPDPSVSLGVLSFLQGGFAILGILSAVFLPLLVERNRLWQGRYIAAVGRAIEASAIDNNMPPRLYLDVHTPRQLGISGTGRILIPIGFIIAAGWGILLYQLHGLSVFLALGLISWVWGFVTSVGIRNEFRS
jgi:hypothetical protein